MIICDFRDMILCRKLWIFSGSSCYVVILCVAGHLVEFVGLH